MIYFVQHKLIIAVKYASLTETEYHRLISAPDKRLYNVYQNQLQLKSDELPNWFTKNVLKDYL